MTEPDDEFRVVSWNIEHNGQDGSSDTNTGRWHLAMELLAALRPHVLLRQELTHAHRHGARAMWAEAARLGGNGPSFAAFLAAGTPESANATGVYVDPSLCEPTEYHEHVTGMWHPACNPVVRLKGTLSKLSLASVHLCSFDGEWRAREARRLTTLGKPGMAAILAGDFNSYPHRITERANLPNWRTIADRSHFEHRTVERAGRRVSDTVPDEILSAAHDGQPAVFTELGHYAATELGQPSALHPTASLWRQDQGRPQRIDRIYATAQIAQALTRIETIDTEATRKVSDHAPVLATFSLAALRTALYPDPTCTNT